jgi:transcriptional regulator with XRE-family HTH domain
MEPEAQALTAQIGLRLRKARQAQNLSLSQLSVRTDGVLSKSRISNYEQGLRRPGIEEARALATALGTVSATFLLCLDDEGFLSDQEGELVRLFRETDQRGRDAIIARSQREIDRS